MERYRFPRHHRVQGWEPTRQTLDRVTPRGGAKQRISSTRHSTIRERPSDGKAIHGVQLPALHKPSSSASSRPLLYVPAGGGAWNDGASTPLTRSSLPCGRVRTMGLRFLSFLCGSSATVDGIHDRKNRMPESFAAAGRLAWFESTEGCDGACQRRPARFSLS